MLSGQFSNLLRNGQSPAVIFCSLTSAVRVSPVRVSTAKPATILTEKPRETGGIPVWCGRKGDRGLRGRSAAGMEWGHEQEWNGDMNRNGIET